LCCHAGLLAFEVQLDHAKVLISRWVKYHVNCNLLSSQKELRSLVFSSASNNYYKFSKIHFPCASNNHKNLSNISRSNARGIYLVIKRKRDEKIIKYVIKEKKQKQKQRIERCTLNEKENHVTECYVFMLSLF
jgi:hypothetical protein